MGSNSSAAVDCLPLFADHVSKYLYVMKKGGGSKSTITIRPSKSVLVYALHSLEYVLGLARFRVFVPNLYIILMATQSSVVLEVERWPYTPNAVGSNPSAAVDCLP